MGHLRTFDDTVVDDKEEDDDDDEDDWTFGKFATKYSNIRFFKLAFSSDLYFNSLSLASVMATNSDSAASGAEKFSNGSKYVFTVNNENPFVFSFDIVSYSTRVNILLPTSRTFFGIPCVGSIYPVCIASMSPKELLELSSTKCFLFITPPILTFVGCQSKSVLIKSLLFCIAQFARNNGCPPSSSIFLNKLSNTRLVAISIFSS